MAADILTFLKKQHSLPEKYYILEVSATLQALQRETLQQKIPDCLDHVVWLSTLPEKPIKGVIVANEVLDAMPVHLITLLANNGGIKECYVTCDATGQLALMHGEVSDPALLVAREWIGSNPVGYTTEVNLNIAPWIKSISECLSEGAVILIDYGFLRHEYYHPDRHIGTLMCHYRHYAHGDPFWYPGLQDITAHVDFTAVGEAAVKQGFSVEYMNQARFLLENKLLSMRESHFDEKIRFLQNQQRIKLTSPNEMGELFKVMVLTR